MFFYNKDKLRRSVIQKCNFNPHVKHLLCLSNVKHKEILSIASNPTEMQVNYQPSRAKEDTEVR